VSVGDRLVRDGGDAGVEQRPCQAWLRREVQVGEQHLSLAEHRDLLLLRLLDLQDEIGAPEHRRGVRDDDGAGGLVGRVVDAAPKTRPFLHEDRMSGLDERANPGGDQADPVLVVLDFPGNSDLHTEASACPGGPTAASQLLSIWAFCSLPE